MAQTEPVATREPCPRCYWDSTGQECEQTCEHPACEPCAHARWAEANPEAAAEEEREREDAERQRLEESGDLEELPF